MNDKKVPRRDEYPHVLGIATRWMDNDVYGHVNNVIYYSFFDTVIADYLIREGGLDFAAGPVIGLAVESACRYRRAIAYPERLDGGLRVAHLGNSSVRYEIGIFAAEEDEAAADGLFVHVFVDRHTRRPCAMPESIRSALARISV
jgi:acyl-CoA thioester hydrolase